MRVPKDLENRAINTIRFLAADAVQKANSGHPGLPMGDAAIAYTLWTQHMRFNPKNPKWPGRDRFILSGGHGSALIYSMLFLTGYDLPLQQLMDFRQWQSQTPGHPEYGLTPGIEVTTGPLGQGFGNGVGMAIAATHLAAEFNKPAFNIIDNYVYAIVTDGDLMEGVASEAASLAGHLSLGRLIYLYDNNHITIDGSTDLAFTEDRAARFKAYGWHVQKVMDGNDLFAIDRAINKAKKDPRPSLIICRTTIGYGLPTKQGTEQAHGEAPGQAELDAAKRDLGWPEEPKFYVPDDVMELYRKSIKRGARIEKAWREMFNNYKREFPDLGSELERRLALELPLGWDADMPTFPADAKGMATRASSGKVLNTFASRLPELMGGSADLTKSNDTEIKDTPDFQKDTPQGRYIHFGVREHGMGAAVNGMAVNGGLIPFGGTFLIFSDYMRPAVRLSALGSYPSIWIYTHDSIGLGEDGPTHQPVEHLAALRAIHNLMVIRPADANEVTEAWKVAIARRNGPTALIFTRQGVPTLDRTKYAPAAGLQKGAYILADRGTAEPEIILMATGSEVQLIVAAGEQLANEGVNVRIVSFPSWELFEMQGEEYQKQIFPPHIKKRLSIEAGVSQGWERWVGDAGDTIAVERYGASAPYKIIFENFGFTVENVLNHARKLLGKTKTGE